MSEHKNPIEQAVDLFFYAPLGLLMNAEEVIPQLVEKGRQQAAVARMFGRFAVRHGQSEAAKAVNRVQQQFAGARVITPSPVRAVPDAEPGPRAAPAGANSKSNSHSSSPAKSPAESKPSRGQGGGPNAASLAIPDYDSLSASQVVPRLDGLAVEELDAVRRYEVANRGRQTILNKIAQLQG